jgi:hypothetical protein
MQSLSKIFRHEAAPLDAMQRGTGGEAFLKTTKVNDEEQ